MNELRTVCKILENFIDIGVFIMTYQNEIVLKQMKLLLKLDQLITLAKQEFWIVPRLRPRIYIEMFQRFFSNYRIAL